MARNAGRRAGRTGSADAPADAEAPCATAPHGCEIGELFRLLSKSHVLDLLHLFIQGGGPRRFVDLQARLRISPNTLSDRLKALVDAGLLTRTAYNQIPPRVDYEATGKARDLRVVFDALTAWAGEHDLARAAPAPPAPAAAAGPDASAAPAPPLRTR